MSGLPVGEEEDAPGALRDTLDLRLLETAARYLYVNMLPLPVVIVGLGLVFWTWRSLAVVFAWALPTLLAWALLGALLRMFLKDEHRFVRRRAWALGLGAALFVASSLFAAAALIFWVQGDRLNNVLLYVFVAACLANAGGQSAPSRVLAAANLLPYGTMFVSLFLIHEAYPANCVIAGVATLYCGLVVIYAKSVRQLAYEMLHLREEKRALITRLETALADATRARNRAETASRAKSQFLANMSHELRTPLNAVLGFSEVIRDRLFGDGAMARYSEYADSIHVSGTHLLGLINDILDLSKIEAGKLELAPEGFDLVADMNEALRLVEPQASRKRITLMREMPGTFEIVADKRALRQIAVNLLANAVKFTPPDGTVTLTLARGQDGATRLAIRDTGIGIRPEDMERVLESFGQGRHDISPTEEHGTGLGLAIAKSLIEAHGGHIALESEVGEGTTVTVILPQDADLVTRAA